MRLASLRARLLLAALLWMVGLFSIGLLISTEIMMRHPGYPRAFHGLAMNHGRLLTATAVACMLLGVWQMRRGLAAFARLRARLAAVHAGTERQIDGGYPTEVEPLVTDLNALLDHRERVVRRALAKAGDLAHGLKTPLAVLAHEAQRASAAGQSETAAVICEQVERMRRQVDYHLAHARAAASGATPGARCSVVASAEGLARTLLRLHAERGVAIDVAVPAAASVRTEREDLDEMLGNLLDNACKWARSRVAIGASTNGSTVSIVVDDDGPGLPPDKRSIVLQRGVRADEAAPGSGFGLAIVREIAELYGGSIELDASPLGGLRATLTLPT
jgi:signal transduction histidine kinase